MEEGPANVTLTIFTPAFNRAHLLPRLFESIKSQVRPSDPVEWLVVDDGSTDDTAEILNQMKDERPDLVRFVRTENGGKHRAVNQAVQVARGDWIMIADSDDRLANGAIADVERTVGTIGSSSAIGVLRALRLFPGSSSGHRFRIPRNPCRHSEWVSSQRPYDTAEVRLLEVLKLYPFPEVPEERFMAEGWLWYTIEKTHLTLFVNNSWIECFYQDDGLSAASRRNRAASPCSAMLVYQAMIESSLSFPRRLRSSVNWWRYYFHAAFLHKTVPQEFSASNAYALLGWLMYLRDRLSKR